jgi:hypothetical protein
MVENTNNYYIGAWYSDDKKRYYQSLVTKPVIWRKYQTIIFDKNNDIINVIFHAS